MLFSAGGGASATHFLSAGRRQYITPLAGRRIGITAKALLHKKTPDCTFTNSTGDAAPVPLQLEKPA